MGSLNAGAAPPLVAIVARIKPTLRDQESWEIKIEQDPKRGREATEEAIDRAFAQMRDKVREVLL